MVATISSGVNGDSAILIMDLWRRVRRPRPGRVASKVGRGRRTRREPCQRQAIYSHSITDPLLFSCLDRTIRCQRVVRCHVQVFRPDPCVVTPLVCRGARRRSVVGSGSRKCGGLASPQLPARADLERDVLARWPKGSGLCRHARPRGLGGRGEKRPDRTVEPRTVS